MSKQGDESKCSNNLASRSIMEKNFLEVCELFDKITKTNHAWHTRASEVGSGNLEKGWAHEQSRKKKKKRMK